MNPLRKEYKQTMQTSDLPHGLNATQIIWGGDHLQLIGIDWQDREKGHLKDNTTINQWRIGGGGSRDEIVLQGKEEEKSSTI